MGKALNLSSVSTCVLLVYNPTYLCMVSFTTAMPSPYIYKMTTRWLTILHQEGVWSKLVYPEVQ